VVQFQAAFEALHLSRNADATGQLARFSRELQELEDHLPIDAKYRNRNSAASSPIRVADVVFCLRGW